MSISLREIKLKSGVISFRIDYYKHGRKYYETIPNLRVNPKDREEYKTARSLAERIVAKRMVYDVAGAEEVPVAERQRECFIEFFERLTEQRTKDGMPSAGSWRAVLRRMKEFQSQPFPMSAVSAHWLESFQGWLEKRMKVNSAGAMITCLIAALNIAVKRDIIVKSPAVKMTRTAKQEVIKEFLSIDEVRAMADTVIEVNYVKLTPAQMNIVSVMEMSETASNMRRITRTRLESIRNAFLFSCFTGLRWSDVKLIKWKDVQVIGGRVHIVFAQQKTRQVEYMPISETAAAMIEKQHEVFGKHEIDVVFDLPKVSPSANQYIRKWAKAAGITKHVHFHTARHTFATLSLTSGVDLYTVSKLLGHKNIQTTQHYAKVVDSKKLDAVKMLPKL